MVKEHVGVKRVAFDALQDHDKHITSDDQVHFYEIIEDYGGGTLLLAEFKDTNDPEDENLYHFQVIVRGSKGRVHTGWSGAYREGQRYRRNLVEQLTNADVFVPLLTLVLLVSFLFFAWDKKSDPAFDAAETLSAAITSVIAFWFGRQTVS